MEIFLARYDKETTRNAYKGVLRPFVAAIGPKRDVDIITPVDIQRYIGDLQARETRFADHPRRPTEDGKLSSFTIRKHVKSIKTFFNWMVELEILPKSPVKLPEKRLPQAVGKERMATDEEVELILKACFGHVRNYALALFLADTTCRAGGAANLLLENLDVDNFEAHILEKGGKINTVWFGAETAQALKKWLKARPKTDHKYVFCATRKPYQKLKSESVSNVIERAAVDAGIERPIHSHALRHWKADKLSQITDANTTSLILGHNDPVITMQYYYHDNVKRAKEAVQKLSYSPSKQPHNIIPFRKAN